MYTYWYVDYTIMCIYFGNFMIIVNEELRLQSEGVLTKTRLVRRNPLNLVKNWILVNVMSEFTGLRLRSLHVLNSYIFSILLKMH